ncbi:MAG: hypothetical protein J0H29_22905 [Sphingobacteriales bacterium]|nr:hypothetical protein [Sphingobacteriales bacterium]OJY89680.1 MAG: hypothetical protein BGP14_22485 [Sphingobacteriales bacterium 44-15]
MLLKPSAFILFCLLVYSYSLNAQQAKKSQLEVTGSIDFALNEGYPLWGVESHVKLLFPAGQKNNAFIGTIL